MSRAHSQGPQANYRDRASFEDLFLLGRGPEERSYPCFGSQMEGLQLSTSQYTNQSRRCLWSLLSFFSFLSAREGSVGTCAGKFVRAGIAAEHSVAAVNAASANAANVNAAACPCVRVSGAWLR